MEKETIINQLKINIYYSFSQSSFQHKESLIESIINQFDQQLNKLIKSVYLTLTLREIHETKKWNNLLVLKESASLRQVNCESSSKSINTSNTNTNQCVGGASKGEITDESTGSENK